MYLHPPVTLRFFTPELVYVYIDQTIRHHIQEDDSFNQHDCVDHKFRTHVLKFPSLRMHDLASHHNKTTGRKAER
jgi:hypothetical protein